MRLPEPARLAATIGLGVCASIGGVALLSRFTDLERDRERLMWVVAGLTFALTFAVARLLRPRA